jgi:hypothetical protein
VDSLFAHIRKVIVLGFQPPVDSRPSDVRKAGVRLALLGIPVLALGMAVTAFASVLLPKLAHVDPWFADTDAAVKIAMPFLFAGFAAIVVGGYRAVFATDPTRDGRSPALRIAVGVGFGCGSLVVLLLVGMVVAGIVLELAKAAR